MLRHHYQLDLATLTPYQARAYMLRLPLIVESDEQSRVEAKAEIRRGARHA